MRQDSATDEFVRVISHAGRLIAFSSRETDGGSGQSRIGYTILRPSGENPNQDEAWKDFALLSFPREIRTACRSVITIDLKTTEIPVAATAFEAVSDGRHVYLFRQSINGTLYVDRFVYEEATGRLVNTWEVRFRRSRKQDIPLDQKDTFGSTDMNGRRFIEPTTELDFVTNVSQGRFAVVILPTELAGVERWQILAQDASDGRLNSFSIARSTDGLFDLSDVIDGAGTVMPNRRMRLLSASGTVLPLQSGCRAVVYNQQEWQKDAYGATTLQKRETRVMVAVASGPERRVSILDFAVGRDGFLAQGPEDLVVSPIPQVGTALMFTREAGTVVDIPKLPAGAQATVEAWVYPHACSAGVDFLVQSAADAPTPFALYLDNGVPAFSWGGKTTRGELPLVTRGWTHLAGVGGSDEQRLYVNGRPFTGTDATSCAFENAPTTGYRLGGQEGLTGLLDEVRLWNAERTANEIVSTMCVPVTAKTPGFDNLLGYWKMDEPGDDTRFTTVANASSLGPAGNGALKGPRWMPSSAPVGACMPPLAWDNNGLTVATGELPWCATGCAPVLIEGADSCVHLYFSDAIDHKALAAHYSVVVSRATYTVAWHAPDAKCADNDQSGTVTFVARQSGTVMNNPTDSAAYVVIEAIAGHPAHANVTLTSYTGYREVWPRVPLALPDFADVLNGVAAQASSNPVELARGVLMYDYTSVTVAPAGGQRGPAPAPGGGSALFRVLVDSLPSNGQVAMVATSDREPVGRGRAGTDGWWQAGIPYVGLNLSEGGQFVRVLSAEAAGAYSGPLLLDRDLGIEAWIKPAAGVSDTDRTLFAFNKPGGAQYMLGLSKEGLPFAGSGGVVARCQIPVPSDGTWTHLAASFRTDFGVQLGGARYLDAGNDRSLDTAEALTVEGWVRLDRLGAPAAVGAKWDPHGGKSWQMTIDGAGHLVFTVNQATATGETARSEKSAAALTLGEWHHVAGVYDVAFGREVAIMFCRGAYVAIPSPSSPPTEGVTIAMWVKTTGAVKPGVQVLFTSVDPDAPLPVTLQLRDGIPEFRVWVKGVLYQRKANVVLRAEDWVHIAGSYNAVDGILLALDGVPVATSSDIATEPQVAARECWPEREMLLAASGTAAYTAGGHASGESSFTGAINEVSLWNRGLNIDAIRQKIRHPLAGTEVGIAGYWRFNDLFGTTVMDLVGTANGELKGGNFIRVDKGAFAHKVFIDGQIQGFSRVTDPIVTTESKLSLGSGDFVDYLQGAIAETRIWKMGRMNWQIAFFAARELEPNAEGLVSLWSFESGKGRVVFDAKSDNNAVIRDGELELTDEAVDAMWIRTSFKAGWTFYINGCLAPSARQVGEQLSYGAAQATIAALRVDGAVGADYKGELNELRIWSGQLTGAQVRTSMYSALSGAEPGLAGYWPIDDGSGVIITDRTAQGGNGKWIGFETSPRWQLSSAPVGREIPQIRSVPGGSVLPQNATCAAAPETGSYGQVFDKPRGGMSSSLLQAYAIVNPSSVLGLYAGFKVGDLDLQFIGQAQLEPTLVGFIEGPPPVPSENLKLYPNAPGAYLGCATVSLDEIDNETLSYNASRSVGTETNVSMKTGFGVSSETSAGIGVQTEVSAASFQLGISARFDETQKDEGNATVTEERILNTRRYVEVYGQWAPNKYQIDAGVGDMLFPNNCGFAQVRAGTADLFAMRLKGTGGIVGYEVRPNPDIPEDVNVIMFKLRPSYVKNGTLDGWIGFQPEQEFKYLKPGEHASYFRPLEAYALKQQIEREQQQRRTFFDNFDAASLGRREKAGRPGSIDVAQRDRSLANVLMGLTSKNGLSVAEWKSRMARRSLANTYVWTAEGGLFAEEQQFLAVREEATGGAYTLTSAAGVYTELSFNIGPTYSLDAMFGSTIMTQVLKSRRDTCQFMMNVSVTGERYLGTIRLDEGGNYVYTDTPSPGKVKAYRFMSFYLAPSKRNFDDFRAIIDEDWLNGEGPYAGQYNPDALALRQALNRPNEVWRLLHRVTYVSRVPPTTHNQGESVGSAATRPDQISITNNLALITELPANPTDPNPMAKVSLEADALLARLGKNPVWGPRLLQESKKIKADIMVYMSNYYGIPTEQ